MAKLHHLVIASVLISTYSFPQGLDRHVDRIFVNGKIWTEDDTQPQAQALAVSGDTIIAVGSDRDIKALASRDTAVVDLERRLVVPGFQDSHLHFPGRSVNEIDLHGVETLKDFQQRLSDFAKAHPSLPWITGHGWGYSAFPNQTVDKRYIDAVISDRPVYLLERDGHMGFGNSKALQMAGVTNSTPDPPNGHIMKSASGEPTGEFKEMAQDLIFSKIPRRTMEDQYQSLLQHMDEAAAAGLTAVQDAYTNLDTLPVFERAAAADKLKLRFRFAPPLLPTVKDAAPPKHRLDTPLTEADLETYKKLRETFQGPLLKTA